MPAYPTGCCGGYRPLSSSAFESGALPPVASYWEAIGGGFWAIGKVRSRPQASIPRSIRPILWPGSRLMWPVARPQVRLCASRSAPPAAARPPASPGWSPPPMPPPPPSRAVAAVPAGRRQRLSSPNLTGPESYLCRCECPCARTACRVCPVVPGGSGAPIGCRRKSPDHRTHML